MAFHNNGKITYWINGNRFYNTSSSIHDGKIKAEKYCLDNFINPKSIIKFDSMLECNRYEYLLTQQNEGKIKNLSHHFILQVQPEFINCNGDTIPAITYNADFIYYDIVENKKVVEDVKGASLFTDSRFECLKSYFDYKFFDKGLYIKVILWRGGWIEWRIGEQKKSRKLINAQKEKIRQLKSEKQQLSKVSKLKERLNELNAKIKLTKTEQMRKTQIENTLNKKATD